MSFLAAVRVRAGSTRRRIVFPEIDDPRTLEAVRRLTDLQIVDPVLIITAATAAPTRKAAAAVGAEVVDASTAALSREIVDALMDARGGKGLELEEARRLAGDPLMAADAMVRLGRVDGCVAGAVHTTGDVLRAALWLVGPAEGVRTVSSAFYMVVPAFRGDDEEVLTFTDCAVVPAPNASQLADIAIAAGIDRRRIVGDEPVIAFLSFSTKGSGSGPSVALVQEAVGLVRARAPELAVDGELQGDAALVAEYPPADMTVERIGDLANESWLMADR